MPPPLRVAALIDLPRSAQSGGHVKCWERLAQAGAGGHLPLDLTVYFSDSRPDETLNPQSRLRHLPPVFSTANLKFLPYTPDKTDLSPWHPRLARELKHYDLIHTTDGFFAFARTAAKIARNRNIPLTTSFHTDTPAYARIFTRLTIEKLTQNWPGLRRRLTEDWNLPEKQGLAMERKLAAHIRACRYALWTRPEDKTMAETILGADRVHPLRLGIDKQMFGTHRAARAEIRRMYNIPDNHIVALFVGRVDTAKKIDTLIEATEKLIAQGAPLHLIVAGTGPLESEVRHRLGTHVTLAGYINPDDLARLYASVDVLTIASEVEIRSMIGGEALISGCPILVSRKSGIAPLFDNTPAMQTIDSGANNWALALAEFMADPRKRDLMRMAAISYGEHSLPSWEKILAEDLFPVWQRAAAETRNAAA